MLMLPRGNIDGGVNARACGMCHIATISATHMAGFDAVMLGFKSQTSRDKCRTVAEKNLFFFN